MPRLFAPHGREAPGQAFTITELLVVLTLISLFLALSIPSFTRFIERNSMISAAESLRGSLRQAQLRAIYQRRTVRLSLQAEKIGTQDQAVHLSISADWGTGSFRERLPDWVKLEAKSDDPDALLSYGTGASKTYLYFPVWFRPDGTVAFSTADGRPREDREYARLHLFGRRPKDEIWVVLYRDTGRVLVISDESQFE